MRTGASVFGVSVPDAMAGLAVRTVAALVGVMSLLLAAAPVGAGVAPIGADGKIPTLAPLLKSVTPAVVNIAVLTVSGAPQSPLMQDPYFRRFFNLPERQQPQTSAGSGVIVDAQKGYVVTNHHVVRHAREILVTLKDRRQFPAKLVGSDAGTDIALLQIDPTNLTALRFGDSDDLAVGDYVLAIGNPFGIGQTVTSGIVSALGRTGLHIDGYEDFIQTDASINPGNSGGALVSLRGELIGINTAIIGPGGGNVGIGFAVPSAMVEKVVMQLARFGEVRRGRFGATAQDVTPELARALGVPVNEGAMLVDVAAAAPAEKAGLKRGDVVTAINGRPVRGSADLRNQLGLVPVGDVVELRVLRDGKVVNAKVTIDPPHTGLLSGRQSVAELVGGRFGTLARNGRPEAVAVVEVEQASPAWQTGLRAGDIIVGVNRRKIRTVEELGSQLRASPRPVTLNIVRGDFEVTLVIRG